jgi:diguanylate cyclase (GGDEF)-like protein/PAS domain S-box-containing protein
MRKNLAREAGLHGAIFFPVLSEGKTIGVLTFNSREVREPDDRLLRAVSVIGSQIGQFVQRKQAEDVLRQSEERFRSLTGLSSDIYWEQDDQFRFISMAGTGSHGSDTRNLPRIGKKRWEENFVNMSPDAWAAHIALLEARKPFHDLELCRLHESGKKTWGSVSGEPVFDASGAFKGYRGVGKDITERKRAEQLRELEHAVNRSLAAADSASAGLKAVIRAVCETEGWECGRYFLLDEEAGLLRFADAWSVPDPAFERFIAGSRDHVYRPGVGLSGRAWQLGRPLWATDVTNDPRTSSGAANAGPSHAIGIHGAFVFPVLADGKTIGVLNFANRKAREPEEQLLQAISVIGSQIGQFVQRKQAEEVLRKSEERFRSLTQLSYDVYWEQDEQYRFTSLNGPDWMKTAQSKLLGATRWEQNYLNITPEGWAAHIAVLDAREPFHDLELCRLDQRGERVWISVSGEPMFDESGAFRGYRGVGKDITARKRDEMVLRLEHTVTRCLAESDSASVAMQEVVRAVCETFDWECGRYFRVDEAAGVLRFGEAWAVPGAEMERYIARWREVSYVRGVGLAGLAWQSGEPQWAADLTSDPRISRRAIACDAGMRGAFVFPATSEGKVLGVFAFNSLEVREPDERLLTSIKVIGSQIGQFLQRKQGEEILRKSEERFNLAVRATNDVIWDWNLVTDELWWNENITNVFGYGEGEIGRTNKAWHDRIHPEDQDRISSAVRRVIDSGGESWSDEYSFRRQDGTYARVFDRGHVIRDDSGRAVRMIGAMADITVRKEAEERLAYLAQFDSLTGLPNRHLFRDRLMQTMARARRADKPMAVLFIDLDRFKLVNDTLGHSAGDRLLKEATQRLQSCVRSSDTVGRFGGDEFGAILTDLAKPADASLVAQKIIDALARPFHLDGHESYVTASIGITLFPSDGEEAGTLIMNADAAMYRAKEQGRNAYQYFTREMNERAMQRVKMETALRRAIERKEFLLHYQPKVNLDSGEVCGFEALLRWQHPARGLVPPLEFIPVLEDTGLIVAVGEWVIGEVCGQIRNWQQSGLTVPPVAINLSARQFQQKGLEDAVRRMLAESDVDPSLLQFELTESLLMKDPEAAARTLQGLKDSGVKLSVDDFGTGYSSLSYLKRFPIDALKIDRTFIGDVTVDPDDAAITLAIIGLGHSLKLNVIAEGVETEGQLEFLKAHACDEMQGYLFSRPVGSDECARMLREGRRLGQTHGRVTRFPGPNGGRPSRARVGRG